MAGPGEGFTGHSPWVGMAQDLSAAGGADNRGDMGQPDDAGQVHLAQAASQGEVARYYWGISGSEELGGYRAISSGRKRLPS